jgi:hypothetical protein
MPKILRAMPWLLAGWIAYVYLWYLQYKFLGHPGSVDLFTTLTDWLGLQGHEKTMRIGTGSAELVASILLFIPATQVLGAAISLAIMTGAIFFHVVSPLGIDPYGDGGILFQQACATWAASLGILAFRREEALARLVPLPVLGPVAARFA